MVDKFMTNSNAELRKADTPPATIRNKKEQNPFSSVFQRESTISFLNTIGITTVQNIKMTPNPCLLSRQTDTYSYRAEFCSFPSFDT